MTAAAHRAAEVFATDQEAVLPFLEANIARNPHVSVRAVALQWGTAISPSLQGEWGVILGSDLTFHKDSFLPLLHSLQTLASPHTRVILAHDDDSVPAGHRLRHEFFNETASAYFAVEEITCAADLDPNFVEDTIHLYELRPLVDVRTGMYAVEAGKKLSLSAEDGLVVRAAVEGARLSLGPVFVGRARWGAPWV